MAIFDISIGIDENLPLWPGDPELRLQWAANIEQGDLVNLTELSMGIHTGTHIDAPLHFLPNGKPIDSLSLNVFVGEAQVVAIPQNVNLITVDILQDVCEINAARILFKTKNSQLWETSKFQQDYVALEASAAQWLVDQGVQLVGIDYLSIAPFKDPAPTHETLLNNEVVIVESLDLRLVKPGIYTLICLPLKLVGREAAPARAILLSPEV
ncbi:MAG TPA: cyclase family protein [Anaerolineaceae bacterium]|jgi:arylformamidase|nr:cyclase [Anaerolineaceae bacterium]HUM49871.1 cyclase family protein [Anaerolineaceae bacterium]